MGSKLFGYQTTFCSPKIGGSAIRYVDLVGTMSQQMWSGSSAAITEETLSNLIGSTSVVYEYDYVQTTTGLGKSISGGLKTKLFTGADRNFRVQWVEVEHNGRIGVRIGSDDVGWTGVYIVPSSGAALKRSRVVVNKTFREIHVECLTWDTGSKVRSVAVKTREASGWNI